MRQLKIFSMLMTINFAIVTFISDARADSANVPTLDKSAIEKIVKDYLLEHPEVIEEAVRVLNARREAAEKNRAQAALTAHQDALRHHPMSPISGNTDGDITVVEFFDYQCDHCKRSLTSMVNLLENDKNVRIVWKELPILGPASRIAARAAMAAKKQDKYLEFHIAVMGSRGRLNEQKIMSIASKVGLNTDRLQEDMKDPAIEAYLDETLQLANSLGIRGTPAFVIADTLVPGAIDDAGIKRIIAEARAGG